MPLSDSVIKVSVELAAPATGENRTEDKVSIPASRNDVERKRIRIKRLHILSGVG
ncbi:hypothetical protein D3C81_2069040 [compost metagenome]